jgi:hypothetical protein
MNEIIANPQAAQPDAQPAPAQPAKPAAPASTGVVVPPEQIVYALWLDWGLKAGLALLVVTFALYVLGVVEPHVSMEELPRYWGMPANDYLREAGVGTSMYYPGPVPHLKYYRDKYQLGGTPFPNATRISQQSIALSVGPHLDEDDMNYTAAALKKVLGDLK